MSSPHLFADLPIFQPEAEDIAVIAERIGCGCAVTEQTAALGFDLACKQELVAGLVAQRQLAALFVAHAVKQLQFDWRCLRLGVTRRGSFRRPQHKARLLSSACSGLQHHDDGNHGVKFGLPSTGESCLVRGLLATTACLVPNLFFEQAGLPSVAHLLADGIALNQNRLRHQGFFGNEIIDNHVDQQSAEQQHGRDKNQAKQPDDFHRKTKITKIGHRVIPKN